MTYGNLKFRLTKMFPGVDLDIVEGFIADRYAEILGELPWSRLNVEAMLLTAAPYSTGTVAVTQGSTAIVLAGGAWTAAMNGQAFRTVGRSEFYAFTFSDATHGALDRPYEGDASTAAGYSLFQHIYPLPADCRLFMKLSRSLSCLTRSMVWPVCLANMAFRRVLVSMTSRA